jgi:hypothetical protein
VFEDPQATTTTQISAADAATMRRSGDTRRAPRSFRTRVVVPHSV